MIDCSKTENYFKEKARMTKANGDNCTINCADCPLSSDNNDAEILCDSFEKLYPDKAIAIVQKWSNEHPQKTILQDFLKKYPNAVLSTDETFVYKVCPYQLGYEANMHCSKLNNSCERCWNRPLSEVSHEQTT